MRRPVKIAIVAWFVIVIATPLVLFGLGRRAPAFENRALAQRPDIRWNNAYRLSTYKQLDAFVRDRLPLRDRAVEERSRIAREVFDDGAGLGQSVADAPVRRGKDGWLYLGEEFVTCDSPHTPREAREALETLIAAAPTAGRRLVVAVAPGKAHIEAAHLGELDDDDRCSRDKERELERELHGRPGFVDLYGALAAARNAGGATGEPLYYKLDSHWNEHGQVVAAQAIVDAIQPGVWRSTDGRPGETHESSGDLSLLAGDLSAREQVVLYPVDRPGVQAGVVPLPGGTLDTLAQSTATATDPTALIPGRSLLVGDSQAFRAVARWGWFFSDLTMCHRQLEADGTCSALLAGRDLVILEIVERHVYGELDGVAFGQLLAGLVAGAPGDPYVLPGQVPASAGGTLTLTGGVVDLPVIAADAGGRRVIRATVSNETAGAPVQLSLVGTDGMPIAGPFTHTVVPIGTGVPVVLTIPDGVALPDVRLRVEAPPGAQLQPDGIVALPS